MIQNFLEGIFQAEKQDDNCDTLTIPTKLMSQIDFKALCQWLRKTYSAVSPKS